MQIKHRIRTVLLIIVLSLIATCMCFSNYDKNSYLSGWDTLHPEFNMSLYWERITSVWQSHQGLGAPPSQSHIAEIPRMFFLSLFSFFVSQNLIRYSFFFLTIVIGPIGVFIFIESLINDTYSREQSINSYASFLGSLFYLLNYGTIQQFIVPFEMFATMYALLGFVFFFLNKYLKTQHKSYLLGYIISILFSSAIAHTATLWYVFFLGITMFLVSRMYLDKVRLKTVIAVLFVTVAINSFWILPQIYYAVTESKSVINSKIHRLSSEETYHYNKKFGTINNYILMRGFLSEWTIITDDFKAKPLLESWEKYIAQNSVRFCLYLFFSVSLIGIIRTLFRKPHNNALASLILPYIICLVPLLINIPFLSTIISYIRELSPIIKEAFRSPYTKFSLYDIFFRSIFFGYGIYSILIVTKKRIHVRYSRYIVTAILVMFGYAIIYSSVPSFRGFFIHPQMRVKIPEYYFSFFKWSKSLSHDARMLELPFQSLYGWNYYYWNELDQPQIHQSAGFLWFGLPQPLMNREFDRWYQPNEQSYRELSYALSTKNTVLFKNLIHKYQIEYLIIDTSRFNPVAFPSHLEEHKQELMQTIKNTPGIIQYKNFGSLIVYQTSLHNNIKSNFILYTHNLPAVTPKYDTNYYDAVYHTMGNYLTPKDNDTLYYLPGRNIMNTTERIKKSYIKRSNSQVIFRINDINLTNFNYMNLTLPDITRKIFQLEIRIKKIFDKYEAFFNIPTVFTGLNITHKLSLGNLEHAGYISFEDKVFDLQEALSSNSPFLINLKSKSIKIKTYESKALEQNRITASIKKFNLCSNSQGSEYFGSSYKNNTLEMFTNKGSICTDVYFNSTYSASHIIKLYLNADSQGSLSYCIYDETDLSCNSYQKLKNGINTIVLFPEDIISFKFDTTSTNSDQSAFISLEQSAVFQQLPFTYDMSFSNIEQTIKLKNSMSFPFKPPLKTFKATSESKLSKNCDGNKSNITNKEIDNKQMHITYTVEEGTICDNFHFVLPNVQQSYLLSIQSKYLSGLPLRFCVRDSKNNSCLFTDVLTKNKQFDYDYFIIPSYPNLTNGQIELFLKSVGDQKSISQIKNIEIFTFPYEKIQHLLLSKHSQKNYPGHETEHFLPIENKKSQLIYIDISALDNPATLLFDQAYEQNWKGFVMDSSYKYIPQLLAPVFGKSIDESHVLVNNWANGWSITKDNIVNNVYFTAIYLPQYLFYCGILITIITLIIALLPIKKGGTNGIM